MVEVGRSSIQMSCLCVSLVTEEKKSLKRTFQQIQEEEDDDYPGSYSPQDPSAGPLLVCGWVSDGSSSQSRLLWCSHKVGLPTRAVLLGGSAGVEVCGKWNRFFFMLKSGAALGAFRRLKRALGHCQ